MNTRTGTHAHTRARERAQRPNQCSNRAAAQLLSDTHTHAYRHALLVFRGLCCTSYTRARDEQTGSVEVALT